MPLPDDYLDYPHRRHGMDNPHYGWDPADRRAPVKLSSGAKCLVSIVIPLEFFPLNPPKTPFLHPGSMKTPYPDLRHYTTRDYGNRVGVYRLLNALEGVNAKATFAINSEVTRRYPPLISAIRAAGHEIAAHGVSTAHIHHDGLSEDEERTLISETRAALPESTTWMSPARNESYRTLDLIAEAGFTACLDWEADQRPIPMTTQNGSVTGLSLYNELGDMKLLVDRSQSEAEWVEQIVEAASYHVAQYETEGASAFAFTLTPYVAGQPFRMHAVRDILCALTQMEGVTVCTVKDAIKTFEEATQ